MARRTFSIMPVVRVEIRGQRVDARTDIISRFLQWSLDVELWSARGFSINPTSMVGYYRPEDAERIRAWLAEQGATETESAGGW